MILTVVITIYPDSRESADIWPASIDTAQNNSQSVREETAELASRALLRGHSPPRDNGVASTLQNADPQPANERDHNNLGPKDSRESTRPHPIEEESEPPSRSSSHSSSTSQPQSALSEMIRNSPPTEERVSDVDDEEMVDEVGNHIVTVNRGIMSQPTERTALLLKKAAYRSDISPGYGSVQDLESLKTLQQHSTTIGATNFRLFRAGPCQSLRTCANFNNWSGQQIWISGVRQPLSYIPSVILGLLLNVLDALSYGTVFICYD